MCVSAVEPDHLRLVEGAAGDDPVRGRHDGLLAVDPLLTGVFMGRTRDLVFHMAQGVEHLHDWYAAPRLAQILSGDAG